MGSDPNFRPDFRAPNPSASYDPQSVRRYFDAFGEREWQRLEATFQGRSNYAVHRHLLEQHIVPGDRVLDVGCGPGRFAIDLATLDARVTLVDLSDVQLDLARQRLGERQMLDRVEGFQRGDVLDLSAFGDSTYDAVVCFGGVLSYTREKYAAAIGELGRVVRPGGVVLVSVMSLYGAMRLLGPLDAAQVVESIDQHLDWEQVLGGADIVFTRPGSKEFHQPIALFTSRGLSAALTDAGLHVERLASANPLFPQYMKVAQIEASAAASDRLMALEAAVCQNPGLIDAGGHLIAVARRPLS
jgi:2-polyprenyl-3-methyl-5-hydroxy-6-metoxy-1,4-benzoquinol methylase